MTGSGFAADNNNDFNSHVTKLGAALVKGLFKAVSNCSGQISGSPVVVKDGSFIWSTTDIVLACRPNLSLTRHYNSFDARDGLFGKGWSTRCEKSLIRVLDFKNTNADSTVAETTIQYVYRTSIGRRYVFTELTPGNFLSPDGLPGVTLRLTASGLPQLQGLDLSTELYNAQGQLVTELDRNGNGVNYTYRNGVLTSISDNHGRSLSLSYDSTGHVVQVADQTGRIWRYGYAADSTLISVTDPAGSVMRYEYVIVNRPFDAHEYHAISKITDGSGGCHTSYLYRYRSGGELYRRRKYLHLLI